MSSKALMQRYSGGGHSGGSGGGILGLISALGGGNEMTGGLELTPGTNTVNYNPYTPSHPFLDKLGGGRTSHESQALNNYILSQMFSNQMEGQNIKLRGDEERKTIGTHGAEARSTDINKQILDVLRAAGIPDSPENRKLFGSAISQAKINTAGQQANLENQILTSPEGGDAFKRGQIAQMLSPEVANTKALTYNTGPNSITTMPTGNGFAPVKPFTTISGPSETRTATEVGGGDIGGFHIPGKPVLETTYGKGSVSYPAPAFESDASKINDIQTAPQTNNIQPQPQSPINVGQSRPLSSYLSPDVIQSQPQLPPGIQSPEQLIMLQNLIKSLSGYQ